MQPGRQWGSCSAGSMYFLLGKFPFLSRQQCPAPAVTSKHFRCSTCCKPQVEKEGDDCNETQKKLSQAIVNIHQRHLCHLFLCVHSENDREYKNEIRHDEQTLIVPNSDRLKHIYSLFYLLFPFQNHCLTFVWARTPGTQLPFVS